MKTYEEAKTELLLKLKYLEGTIKFLKENSYFEKFCLNCRSIMKVPVNGERGTERKFCNDYCRRNYHYKNRLTAREKQIVHLRQQGKTLVEIGKQFDISKQAISVILQKVKRKMKKNRKYFLDEAEKLINGPRAKEYGPAKFNHERIAKIWSVILAREVTAQEVVACMVGVKLARLAETIEHDDSWVDIIGYAALGGEIINDK